MRICIACDVFFRNLYLYKVEKREKCDQRFKKGIKQGKHEIQWQDMYLGMTDKLSTIQYCTTVPLYDVFGNNITNNT